MAVEPTQKPIHSLILDTGPLIKNVVSISTIINSAEELYTTPAIISEIRDEATRMRVQTTLMPFLKVRNPSPASYDAVIAFSKKTGDHAVLSRQDLGILALAYEIHCERNKGDWGLRSVPKGPIKLRPEEEEEARKQKEAKDAAKAVQEQAALESGQTAEDDEWSTVTKSKKASKKSKGQNKKINKPEQESEQAQSEEMILEQPATEAEPQQKSEESVALDAAQGQAAFLSTEEKPVEVESTSESAQQPVSDDALATESINKDLSSLKITSAQESQTTPPASDDEDEDDNDGDWITETNLPEHQVKDTGLQADVRTQGPSQMDVATMTIDFAMQNVLLQMNLKLITTNMQRIKKLSSKVLRCHACFQIVKDMSKQFCPRCGGATLARVSCSTNAKGEFHIHLAKNYTYNKRGDKYSIPKPIAGTANTKWSGLGGGKGGWGRDLILAEDQKEYTKQQEKEKRQKGSDIMDQDYLPGILTGDRGRAGGRVKVGAGKNVNAKKRH